MWTRARTGWLAVALCAALVAVLALRANGDPVAIPVWSDEFSGVAGSAPDPSIWAFETGGGGWGNRELECYTNNRANSALDGQGDLVITARSTPGGQCSDGTTENYTSARLVTANLRTLQYGHVRVRADLPGAAGMWPAIWAVGADTSQRWPANGEIDIDEKVGSAPTTVNGTLHGDRGDGSVYGIGGTTTETSPGFHVYGVDWTPASIAFSVDGHVYFTAQRSDVQKRGEWNFDHPFYLILNLAVGGTWPGPPTAATSFPQRMLVDYVRVTA